MTLNMAFKNETRKKTTMRISSVNSNVLLFAAKLTLNLTFFSFSCLVDSPDENEN